MQDLRDHVKDWKGHTPDTLGPLYLREVLTVRRGSQEKQYNVHLFENALIFIVENTEDGNRVLHLKGRLYMKSISRAVKVVSSEALQLSLSLDDMPEDQALVTLLFKDDEGKLDRWRHYIAFLAAKARAAPVAKIEIQHSCAAPEPAGTVSEKHTISQAEGGDVESQMLLVVEEKAVQVPSVRGRKCGMAAMFLCKSGVLSSHCDLDTEINFSASLLPFAGLHRHTFFCSKR